MRKDIEELQRQKTTLTTELVKAQQMLKILVDQDKNNQQMEQLKVTQIRSVIKEHNRKIEELYAKINGQKVALEDL